MHRFAQAFSILFISLYAYLSQTGNSINYIWFLLALLLFIIGWALRPHHTMLAAMVIVAGYCGYHLYTVHFADTPAIFGWDALIWLMIFPYAAVMGGIGKTGMALRETGHPASLYQMLRPGTEANDEEMIHMDESLGFLNAVAFLYRLEEEVIRSLGEKEEFTLLIAAIDRFSEYKSLFGFEQAQWLAHQVAERIAEQEKEGFIKIKGHLGEGVFALILPVSSGETSADIEIEARLNEFFIEMLMHRPRREAQVKLRLVYGAALCPADGIEARTLMDRAQSEIEGNVNRG